MHIKSTFILMLSLAVSTFSVQARDCPIVAKIYMSNIINEVSILRKGTKKSIWASKNNRKLCAGDVVQAPNRSISPIIIRYYTEIPKMIKLNKGETHKVESLLEPCGVWCTAWNDIDRLYYKLTSKAPENISDGIGSGRGEDGKNKLLSEITMPLDIGDTFYLFANESAIPLFWRGGQAPYQLEIKDEMGNVITHQTLETNTFSLNIPNTEPEQMYTITISSANSISYRKQLVFAIPPFPIEPKADKLRMLIKLLNHPDKNWRLEIWRQLAIVSKSEARENFAKHLMLTDFE